MNGIGIIALAISLLQPEATLTRSHLTMSWLSKILTSKPGSRVPAAAAAGLTDEDRNDVRVLIRNLAWGGFDSRADIRQTAEESLSQDTWSQSDLAWLDREVDAALDEKRRTERTWSGATAFDKLDQVFTNLKASGILALHRAGNTQSDGWDDANQFRDEAGGASSGFDATVFYHGQDLDRVLEDRVLLLTYGVFPGSMRTAQQIASETVGALVGAGFDAVAPADENQRIEIRNITWTKLTP